MLLPFREVLCYMSQIIIEIHFCRLYSDPKIQITLYSVLKVTIQLHTHTHTHTHTQFLGSSKPAEGLIPYNYKSGSREDVM